MGRQCNRCGKESRYYLNNVCNRYSESAKRPTYLICDECYQRLVGHMTEAFDNFFKGKETENQLTKGGQKCQ